MDKLIITIAHTGNVPTKELNPHTPITASEMVADIKACAELGAAVAHIHVRDAVGRPTSDRARFKEVLDRLEQEQVNIIRQASTGVRGGENTLAWRGQMLDLNLEMATLSTGSSNFPNSVNANFPDVIEALAAKMYDNGIKPEIEVFDLAMIANAERLLKKGVLKEPLHFNFVLNVPGSIPGTPKNLMFMIDSIPTGSTWSVTAVGRAHVQMVTMAIALGGHVRTGLEDVLELENGVAASNITLMERVRKITSAVGREMATPEEARCILSLK